MTKALNSWTILKIAGCEFRIRPAADDTGARWWARELVAGHEWARTMGAKALDPPAPVLDKGMLDAVLRKLLAAFEVAGPWARVRRWHLGWLIRRSKEAVDLVERLTGASEELDLRAQEEAISQLPLAAARALSAGQLREQLINAVAREIQSSIGGIGGGLLAGVIGGVGALLGQALFGSDRGPRAPVPVTVTNRVRLDRRDEPDPVVIVQIPGVGEFLFEEFQVKARRAESRGGTTRLPRRP